MQRYLEKLVNRESLTIDEMKDATNLCFTDTITDSEIAALLTALRAKGETADEITGIVEVIRSHSPLHSNALHNVMDNCGTGGDRSNSFNISTTTAFVLAGAGLKVAKHGNRSISSKTGSADVLEHLGVSLSFSKEQAEEILYENNITFLFAPFVHAKLKHFMKIRKELGFPTIFNVIGPLTNPVELQTQLLGVYRRDLVYMMADALNKLGRKRAIVVNGAGSMDEASLAGENHLALLANGEITPFTLYAEELNLPTYTNDEIRGGDAKENAQILRDVLDGKPGPYMDTVLLNAGLGLFANGKASTIKKGVQLARESITSGAARERLEKLINYSKQMKSEAI
ncbi:anthranilate phosphoribosyltransferase [Virgibacillus sp. W0430]|uniref:anthranilate phosphoribosyltransferase n=1 Tax=Virgibacillus sp. W0430 TaxID=3391580 RepID=UPI003F48146E